MPAAAPAARPASALPRRPVPGFGAEVPVLCLGTMTFGSPVGEPEAVDLVHRALDLGLTFVDTANMYEGYARVPGSAGGVAEEILGKALAGRRNGVVLATKLGMKVGAAPEDEGTSPAAVHLQLERSLKRLRTDRIDLYYLHRFDVSAPQAEVVGALAREIRAGRILAYGVSNYPAEALASLLAVCDAEGLPRPAACQPPLSLLRRDALDALLPLCAREGIAVVPYQALQGGLLTGKYRRGAPPPEGTRGSDKPDWLGTLDDALFDRLEALEAEARAERTDLRTYAFRWTLRQPGVASVLVGASRPSQLEDAVRAVAEGVRT